MSPAETAEPIQTPFGSGGGGGLACDVLYGDAYGGGAGCCHQYFSNLLLPPPKKGVMFLVRSVCLFVCLSVCPSDYSQTCERILTKLFGGVGHGSRTK